jgi:hypothetical protein
MVTVQTYMVVGCGIRGLIRVPALAIHLN